MSDNRNRLGVIDIGSNSIRLIIYEAGNDRTSRMVHKAKETVRLGVRRDEYGNMSEQDIWTVIPILHKFKTICKANRASQIRAVATAAVRQSTNMEDIIARWEQETGIAVQVLSGEEEAYYGFLGVTRSLPAHIDEGFIVDIGGGSTEISYFKHEELLHSTSLPCGAVNMTMQNGSRDTWNEPSRERLAEKISCQLQDYPWTANHAGLPLIGLGGGIRALARMERERKHQLKPAGDPFLIEAETIRFYADALAELDLEERIRKFDLAADRADIIVAGTMILSTVFDHMQCSVLLASWRGLSDGLAHHTFNIAQITQGQMNGPS
ncbi:Ppx/GppA phosphatase family protein [Paenibacillus wulumuqiensis]|uniref:Ppx/GppA phosphatase family protein n=1 Tax=Paenibacillus wulumuqiensis TaxID=1567107 RepID=UPI000696EEB3|nr:diol dehydratase reactivase ATPase-like domain-containing protein [Paenibacillus wulumuqiensis]